MELIQKQVLQVLKNGAPDPNAVYGFKILLTQDATDEGIFDTVAGTTDEPISYTGTMAVTGRSSSRLSELKKYAVNVPFTDQYIGGGSLSVNGVDFTNSNPNGYITYYLGGIKYVDVLTGFTSGTTFSFTTHGMDDDNFTFLPYYKDPNKESIYSNPKITDDVFIVRQELSAFESNYRLEFIKNMVDLETYAGGNYFNIIKNS